MNTKNIAPEVAARILEFFNQVRNVSDITDTLIEDDPSDGPGNTIGPKLASRILNTRSEQPFRQFENLEQLDAIQGFGEGTWKDLVYTFGRTAAEAFRNNLYANNLIFEENWPVHFFEFPLESEEALDELTINEEAYRAFLSEKLASIAEEETVSEQLAESAIQGVKTAYLERFEDPTLSALTFAIWFYRLDPGNWFSFDRMFDETFAYFEYYTPKYDFQRQNFGTNTLLEMIAFKDVPGTILQPAGIAANDMITVANYPERKVTIWMSSLFD